MVFFNDKSNDLIKNFLNIIIFIGFQNNGLKKIKKKLFIGNKQN